MPIQNLENITLSISSVDTCPVIFPTYKVALRKDCAAISIFSSDFDISRYFWIKCNVLVRQYLCLAWLHLGCSKLGFPHLNKIKNVIKHVKQNYNNTNNFCKQFSNIFIIFTKPLSVKHEPKHMVQLES